MNNTYTVPKKEYATVIREIDLNGKRCGGGNALPFMHSETAKKSIPIIVCEILTNIPENYPKILKDCWGDAINKPVESVKIAAKQGISAFAVRFNIENNIETSEDIDSQIKKSINILEEILKIPEIIENPLFLIGSFRKEIDVKLLPALAKAAKAANRKCTIGAVEEDSYKQIAPSVKECGHNIIARTPIDINLTKQLNILLSESGFEPDKIIIDPNTGGLGYGLDYAYSIIERIRIAALQGDTMLNMPIIAFVGEEAWKTKESKSTSFPSEWGELNHRALLWEGITAVSMISAGANMVLMRHLSSIKQVQSFINMSYGAYEGKCK